MTKNKPATRHLLPGSLILAFALVASPAAHGALIAYEGFDYADGTLTGKNGGTGDWNGAWANSGTTGTYGTVSDGKYLTGDSTKNSVRPLTVAASTDPIYFSSTFTKTSATAAYGFWLQLGVTDNAAAGTSTVRIGLANDNFSLRLRTEGGSEVTSDIGTYVVGDTVSIVGKLEFNVSGTNERLSFWVNPTAEETATISSTILGDVGWTAPTHAQIRNITLAAGAASLDDIRIGSSWASVIPEPSTALLGGLGMLCLLRRRRA